MSAPHPRAFIDEVLRRYEREEPIAEIASDLGISPSTVTRFAQRAGVVRCKNHPAETKRRAVELYQGGLGVKPVGRMLGVAHPLVYVWVKAAGVNRSRKESGAMQAAGHPIRWGPLTAERAWLLGLIYGNGGIAANRSVTTLTMDNRDLDVIDKVRGVLGYNFGSIARSGCTQLTISSTSFTKSLAQDFGLDENKGSRMPWPDIAPDLLRHFVRGLWDSDGSWHRHDGHLCVATYASICREFVVQLERSIRNSVDVCPRPVRTVRRQSGSIEGRVLQSGNYFALEYSHFDAVELGRWMYQGGTEHMRGQRKYAEWKRASEVAHKPWVIARHLSHRQKLLASNP